MTAKNTMLVGNNFSGHSVKYIRIEPFDLSCTRVRKRKFDIRFNECGNKDRVTDNATIPMYKTHAWLRYL